MAEEGSKGFTGILGDFAKRLPPLPSFLILAGIFFCVLAVTVNLKIKDSQFAAVSEKWRDVSAGIGFVLLLSGIAFAWRETRAAPKKTPGPYTTSWNFPVKADGPVDTILIARPDQTVTVKGTRKGAAFPDYEVWLMHVDDQKIVPRYDKMVSRVTGTDFSWEIQVKLPDPDRITKEEVWEMAFFYVGSNGLRLVRHHREVCKYFSPQGVEKKWPMFERWPGEIEQCSEIVRIKFDAVGRHSWSENRRPGTTPMPGGPGVPDGRRNIMPGTTPVGGNIRPDRSGTGFEDLPGRGNTPVGGDPRPGSSSGTGFEDPPRAPRPGNL